MRASHGSVGDAAVNFTHALGPCDGCHGRAKSVSLPRALRYAIAAEGIFPEASPSLPCARSDCRSRFFLVSSYCEAASDC